MVPMVYPYFAKDLQLRLSLLTKRIYIATYWPNVLEWTNPIDVENFMTNKLLPLPININEQQLETIINYCNYVSIFE